MVLDRPSDMKNGSAIATTAAKCSDGAAPTYFLGVVAIAQSCVLIWSPPVLGLRNSDRLSCSAQGTTNFTNPEFRFPQFKVLQSVFILLT